MKHLPSKTPHFIVLSICLFIILGGVLLKPPTGKNPYLKLGPLPIPEICTFHNLTGLPCPGCGLTRSLVAGIHGQYKASFAYHPLGLLTLFYIILQIIYRTAVIVIPAQVKFLIRSGKALNKSFLILALLFFINWIYTLVDLSPL